MISHFYTFGKDDSLAVQSSVKQEKEQKSKPKKNETSILSHIQ